jgi:hypothetical protein
MPVFSLADTGAIMLWKRPRGNYPDLETVLEIVADSLVEPFMAGVAHFTITGGDSLAILDRWLSLMRKGWEACVILNRLRSCSKDMGALVAPALARGVCGPFAHLRHSEWLAAYNMAKLTRCQSEFVSNKYSWPHALVRLAAPHDPWMFHPRAGERLSPCIELDEESSESEDISESEESSESET